METKYKYFIENKTTGKWYVSAFNFEIRSTSQYQKPRRPAPTEEDFWTNDPSKAFTLDAKDKAQSYIDETCKLAISKEYIGKEGFYDLAGWNLLDCVVTEHEFM